MMFESYKLKEMTDAELRTIVEGLARQLAETNDELRECELACYRQADELARREMLLTTARQTIEEQRIEVLRLRDRVPSDREEWFGRMLKLTKACGS